MQMQEILIKAKDTGFSQFQLYQRHSKTTTLQLYEQEVDRFTISECKSLQMKGLYEEKLSSMHVEQITEADLDFLFEQMKQNAKVITTKEKECFYAGENSYPVVEKTEHTCLKEPIETKIKLLQDIEQALLAYDPRIVKVMELQLKDLAIQTKIENTLGLHVTKKESFTILYAEILAQDQDDTKSASLWKNIFSFADFDQAAFVKECAEKALSKLHATSLASNTYPVLIKNEAMADLFSCFVNQFYGEQVYQKISLLQDAMQKQVFDEKLNIVDDGLYKDGFASTPFDDEGVRSQCTTLVEKGVVKQFLHNLKSAHLLHATASGNGFGNHVASTNCYIVPMDTTPKEMLASMKQGIIINEVTGLHAGWNTITTDFSLQASGYYVEDGMIQRPIHMITIAANAYDMLKKITSIGNDLYFTLSGIGAPSMLFEAISISGEGKDKNVS